MKKLLCLSMLYLILIFPTAAQKTCPSRDEQKIEFLNKLGGQVDGKNYSKISFAGFSKFIVAEDNEFGRAINYASIQIDKPRATLNLYQKTAEVGFFNLNVLGGYESDLFSLISDKKPAGSFSSTLS